MEMPELGISKSQQTKIFKDQVEESIPLQAIIIVRGTIQETVMPTITQEIRVKEIFINPVMFSAT